MKSILLISLLLASSLAFGQTAHKLTTRPKPPAVAGSTKRFAIPEAGYVNSSNFRFGNTGERVAQAMAESESAAAVKKVADDRKKKETEDANAIAQAKVDEQKGYSINPPGVVTFKNEGGIGTFWADQKKYLLGNFEISNTYELIANSKDLVKDLSDLLRIVNHVDGQSETALLNKPLVFDVVALIKSNAPLLEQRLNFKLHFEADRMPRGLMQERAIADSNAIHGLTTPESPFERNLFIRRAKYIIAMIPNYGKFVAGAMSFVEVKEFEVKLKYNFNTWDPTVIPKTVFDGHDLKEYVSQAGEAILFIAGDKLVEKGGIFVSALIPQPIKTLVLVGKKAVARTLFSVAKPLGSIVFNTAGKVCTAVADVCDAISGRAFDNYDPVFGIKHVTAATENLARIAVDQSPEELSGAAEKAVELEAAKAAQPLEVELKALHDYVETIKWKPLLDLTEAEAGRTVDDTDLFYGYTAKELRADRLNLIHLIEKQPPLPSSVEQVYSGMAVSPDVFKRWTNEVVGQEFPPMCSGCLMSTSTDKEIAGRFATMDMGNNHPVTFIIRAKDKNGASIQGLNVGAIGSTIMKSLGSNAKNEKEILILTKGKKYELLNITPSREEDIITYITLREIGSK